MLKAEMILRARSLMPNRLGLDLVGLRYRQMITGTFALLVFLIFTLDWTFS